MFTVCAPAGSLILWESRTIHYGAAPKEGANPRYATCESSAILGRLSKPDAVQPPILDVCYKPAAHCPPAHIEERKAAIREYTNMVRTLSWNIS